LYRGNQQPLQVFTEFFPVQLYLILTNMPGLIRVDPPPPVRAVVQYYDPKLRVNLKVMPMQPGCPI
jgi:hypothetical protein